MNADITATPLLEKVKSIFNESIQIQIATDQELSVSLVSAAQKMVTCLLSGNKIMVCGQGRAYANGQFLVANLLHRYHLERPSLPAVLLGLDGAVGSAIFADHNPAQLFTRQLESLAQTGDMLVILAPFSIDESILNLIHTANSREIPIIALTGRQNDHLHGALGEYDLDLAIPAQKEARILENHLLVINILCELIEHQLFSH
ncbi:D-sedoheptulose-7-phosphate isomerase [Spirabiliibacterium falconis]|uniref:D-sedoheptulose-7-phosphate isomerase n=1 Tax=Spirabiliibacterium falconis TaxID=572023 RepID=UPI001AAC5559|nr:SIS domain-containing protein [Spirabiliibacterium falconis]MBE2893853.1 SIS domain-containing protein [Spirabiliibacterium falconis]